MARRFRYSFAKQQESQKGRLSVWLMLASLVLFAAAVAVSGRFSGKLSVIPGVLGIFAALLNLYGFILGLSGFSDPGKKHHASIVGSIANGILLVGWIGLYQLGR